VIADAMVQMSRAIRHVIEDNSTPGHTLKDVRDDDLLDFVQITGAFWADLREEAERRGLLA
jgi:hypothetical protein